MLETVLNNNVRVSQIGKEMFLFHIHESTAGRTREPLALRRTLLPGHEDARSPRDVSESFSVESFKLVRFTIRWECRRLVDGLLWFVEPAARGRLFRSRVTQKQTCMSRSGLAPPRALARIAS